MSERIGLSPTEDPILQPPLISRDHGRAWLVDLDAARKSIGKGPGTDGTLAIWIIEAPWAHPMWHSYQLCLVHLRPMPNLPAETKFHLEGATHELWLEALDPKGKRAPFISGDLSHGLTCMPLNPKNFAAQFKAANDTAAITRIRHTVLMVCNGKLSPDTDFRMQWEKLYGDNMVLQGRKFQ